MLRAVTFDFWRTLLWERPGQLERVRIEYWTRVLSEADVTATGQALHEAHDFAFRAADASWRSDRQYRVEHATADMIRHLGLKVSPQMRERLVAAFSEAGLETPLEVAPGVGEAIARLRVAGFRIGIVCDVGLTPSVVLREHLRRRDLLELFDHWSFSDEVGHYKPDVRPFEHACRGLDVDLRQAAHVGDQRRTDVAGALAAGLTAIRYRGVFDDTDESQPEAGMVVDDHRQLADVLGRV